jgi:hypothetical protein
MDQVPTRESTATITVATEVPKSSTDAKTKASETDIRIESFVMRIVKEPVNNVRAAKTNHSDETGCKASAITEIRVSARPTPITIAK